MLLSSRFLPSSVCVSKTPFLLPGYLARSYTPWDTAIKGLRTAQGLNSWSRFTGAVGLFSEAVSGVIAARWRYLTTLEKTANATKLSELLQKIDEQTPNGALQLTVPEQTHPKIRSHRYPANRLHRERGIFSSKRTRAWRHGKKGEKVTATERKPFGLSESSGIECVRS
ncbi:hypothetical protein KQX54_006118 [Cotesia glomerata]|uniref:Uncharacterized protein n=1 Tax=Cotesia glomerata TaxID=32391 RepID=A0AAV7I2M8_COTGL|nr:hypothetical protein KQX54_006118 [Cotesia glomerata]